MYSRRFYGPWGGGLIGGGNGSITLYYNATSGSTSYNICYSGILGNVVAMVVDNKSVVPSATYSFGSSGEHIVDLYFDALTDDVSYIIEDCDAYKVDFSNFSIPEATKMAFWFRYCPNLTTVVGFDAVMSTLPQSDYINAYSWFRNCDSLASLSFLNVEYPQDMRVLNQWVRNCSKLTTLDFAPVSGSYAADILYLCRDCSSLSSVTLRNIWSSYPPSGGSTYPFSCYYAFRNCPALKTVRLYKPISVSSVSSDSSSSVMLGGTTPSGGTVYYKSGTISYFLNNIPSGWSKRTF